MGDETRHLAIRFGAVGVQQIVSAGRTVTRSLNDIAAAQTRVATQSTASGNAMTRAFRFTQFGGARRFHQQIDGIGHALTAIPRNIQGMHGAVGAAMGGLTSIMHGATSLMTRGLVRGFSWMANSAIGILQGLAARARTTLLLGIGMTGAVGVSSLMAFGQQERQKLRLNALMGSPARGAQAFEWIRDFVSKSTLNTAETISAVSSMMTQGLNPASDLRPLMNASAMLGGGSEELERMINYLGQIRAGVRETMALNEMQRMGIPVYRMMADELGVTRTAWMGLNDEQRKNLNLYPALLSAINQWAGNAGESMVNTVIGKYRKLQERIERTKIRIGAVLAPSALQMMDNLANWIERPQTIKAIERWAQTLVTFAQRAFRAVGMLWGRLTLWFSNPANVQRITGWVASMIAGVQQVGRIAQRVLGGIFDGGGGLPPWVAQLIRAFTFMLGMVLTIRATLIGMEIGARTGPAGAIIGSMIGGAIGGMGWAALAVQQNRFFQDNPVGQGSTLADLRERARWNTGEFEADRAAAQAFLSGNIGGVHPGGPGGTGTPEFPSIGGVGGAGAVGAAIGSTIADIIGGRQLARQGISRTELPGMTGGPRGEARIRIETDDGSPISQAMANVSDQAIQQYHNWLFNTPEGRATARAALA